jgi:hypothetical protein
MATSVIKMQLLGRGAHASPRRGCNVLEYASVLAGERWSSRPQSVHDALAQVADIVNDQMTDDSRRLLTPLAPWLLGTTTSDARAWPTLTGVCVRAALACAGEPDKTRLTADLDVAQDWLGEARQPAAGRQRGRRAARRQRRWARHAIWSAVLTVAASADQDAADARLCQLLLDCINQCRQLAGEPAVDPRLPLADCPRTLAVESHTIRSPGCDWMDLGYRPVPALRPGQADASETQPVRGRTESAALHLFRPARLLDERRAKRPGPARNSAPPQRLA